eukprot:2071322-Amphidinium_carterae.1
MKALRVLCGEPGGLSWLSEILMAAEQEGGEGTVLACCLPSELEILRSGQKQKRAPNINFFTLRPEDSL